MMIFIKKILQNVSYVDGLDAFLNAMDIRMQDVVNFFCSSPGNGRGRLQRLNGQLDSFTYILHGFLYEHFSYNNVSACIFDVGDDVISDIRRYVIGIFTANTHSQFCRYCTKNKIFP